MRHKTRKPQPKLLIIAGDLRGERRGVKQIQGSTVTLDSPLRLRWWTRLKRLLWR